jgi:hypothetical protein
MERPVDKAMREFAQKVFSGEDSEHQPCQDCGGVHTRACPRIASMSIVIGQEGDMKGVVTEREVTYWAPGTWEKGIIFADDVWEDDDEQADSSSSE